MAGAMFLVNARDRSTSRYYTMNPRLDHLSGGGVISALRQDCGCAQILWSVPVVLRMSTDPPQKAPLLHQCSDEDWTETSLEDGFVSYDFENGEILDLEEVVLPAGKQARGASAASTSVHLPAIFVVYRKRVLGVSLESVQSDYDEYRGVHSGPDVASREAGADDMSLEERLT